MPGAISVMSLVAGSASWRRGRWVVVSPTRANLLDRWVKRSSRLEHVLAVPAELLDRLADVVEGPVGGRLAGRRFQRPRVPPPGELLDGGDVDRAVVQVLLDLGQVEREEPAVGADRVAAQ